jgi:hypothetical protein
MVYRDTPHSKGVSTGKWNSICGNFIFFNLNNESKSWNQKYKIDKSERNTIFNIKFSEMINFFLLQICLNKSLQYSFEWIHKSNDDK